MGVSGQSHDRTALPPGKRHAIHFTGCRVDPRAGLAPTGIWSPNRSFGRNFHMSSNYFGLNVLIYCSQPKNIFDDKISVICGKDGG